jgi:hypothetical protein
MLKRKLLSFFIILSIITPFFYLPYQAKKAEAIFGIGDLVIDVKALAERIIDGIAMTAAQLVVDKMVQSTVQWAQNGFEGNPSYSTDPKQFFIDTADQAAGKFIQGDEDLGFLCSPFQANIRLSLAQQYYQTQQFQCTMTGVVGNIEDFLADFSQGGWDSWFEMTQNQTNNPYGAYLAAKIELDSRVAAAVGLEQKQLDWNQGFMSWSRCTKTNPPPMREDIDVVFDGVVKTPNLEHVPGKAVGDCIERGPVETPGSTIKAQLDKVLPSGLEKLISVQHVEQLVNAFAAGLLQKFVFGPKGIFARDNRASGQVGGTSDIDGDGTPDGMDTDGDGTIDVCYFGGADGNPSSKPCKGSSNFDSNEAPPSENQCPIPDTPRSLCDNVDSGTVMGILNKYEPNNEGLTQGIEEVKQTYPSAFIIPHDTGSRQLDKIDFGGGLVADVIYCAGGDAPKCEASWSWGVDCQCGGPAQNEPVDQRP